MAGSGSKTNSPCRFNHYALIQNNILKELGYRFEMIVIDQDNFQEIKERFKQIGRSWWRIIDAFRFLWKKLEAAELVEHLSQKVRPFEVNKGDATKVYGRSLELITHASSFNELQDAIKVSRSLYHNIEKDLERNPPKIGIIGERYLVLEPFTNLLTEQLLGEMGALVYRASLTNILSKLRHLLFLDRFSFMNKRRITQLALPYLRYDAGGESIVSVASAILFAKQGFDGIVHIMPFTCIPELIAKSVLEKVKKDFDIPILTLSFDEQSGVEGLITRLETFVDLIKRRNALTK